MITSALKLLILSACVVVVSGGSSGRPSPGRRAPAHRAAPLRLTNNAGGKSWSSRGGMSAWGIIAVVMSAVVGSILAYYVSIFYPILCAQRGKYDVMDMTPV